MKVSAATPLTGPTEPTLAAHETPRSALSHVPGEAGIWIFILGDMTVFAFMFGTYLFYRNRETAVFERSQQTLHESYGVINTLVLLASSLLVAWGVRALRQRQTQIAMWMFVGAIGCGVVFSTNKYFEWGGEVGEGLTPATNNFYMLYFILTGLHFFHLIIGLGVLAFLVRTARRRQLSPTRFAVAEGGACYWHMVDLLWIVLFPLIYLIH